MARRSDPRAYRCLRSCPATRLTGSDCSRRILRAANSPFSMLARTWAGSKAWISWQWRSIPTGVTSLGWQAGFASTATSWISAITPESRLPLTRAGSTTPTAADRRRSMANSPGWRRGARNTPKSPCGGSRLRLAVEQASHRFVVRRRLPPPFDSARIYVSTEGGLRYLARPMARVDPPLLQLAAEVVRHGDTVWDIGANLGLFSFAAAVMAGSEGRVLAVEPDTDLVGLLRRSAAAAAGHAPVEILPVAISDDLSVARFHIARRNRATSHLAGFGSAMAGGVRSTRLVPTVTLDWLAARFPAPDVLKIDVEGAELSALAGGGQVLADSPVVICEVSGQNTAAVSSLLAGHGYTLYDGDQVLGERV